MATAKRVQQDAKRKTVTEPIQSEIFQIVVTNGKEVSRRSVSGPYVGAIRRECIVPQPDRIVLELSLTEAELLLNYNFQRSNPSEDMRVLGLVGRALHDALYPNYGTPTSKAQDSASSGAVSDRYASSIDR